MYLKNTFITLRSNSGILKTITPHLLSHLTETVGARSNTQSIASKLLSMILYPAKLSLNYEGEMKIFLGKQKQASQLTALPSKKW